MLSASRRPLVASTVMTDVLNRANAESEKQQLRLLIPDLIQIGTNNQELLKNYRQLERDDIALAMLLSMTVPPASTDAALYTEWRLIILYRMAIALQLQYIQHYLLSDKEQAEKWGNKANELLTLLNADSDVLRESTHEDPEPTTVTQWLKQKRDNLRKWLKDRWNETLNFIKSLIFSPLKTSRRIFSGVYNMVRLLIVRTRKLASFLSRSPVISKTKLFFAYLSFIWFIPRLLSNLFNLILHTLGIFTEPEEKDLGFTTRATVQLKDIGSELANDSVWFVVNLLTAGLVLTSIFGGAIGINLIIALYFFDILNIVIKIYWVDAPAHKEARDSLKSRIKNSSDNPIAQKILTDQLNQLERKIAHERSKLKLNLAIAILLFIGMAFSFSMLAYAAPVMPLVSVCIVLAVTVLQLAATLYLDHVAAPDKNLSLYKKPSSTTARILRAVPAAAAPTSTAAPTTSAAVPPVPAAEPPAPAASAAASAAVPAALESPPAPLATTESTSSSPTISPNSSRAGSTLTLFSQQAVEGTAPLLSIPSSPGSGGTPNVTPPLTSPASPSPSSF